MYSGLLNGAYRASEETEDQVTSNPEFLIVVTHALMVSWTANLNELFGRTHLLKNIKNPLVVKAQSKLKKP